MSFIYCRWIFYYLVCTRSCCIPNSNMPNMIMLHVNSNIYFDLLQNKNVYRYRLTIYRFDFLVQYDNVGFFRYYQNYTKNSTSYDVIITNRLYAFKIQTIFIVVIQISNIFTYIRTCLLSCKFDSIFNIKERKEPIYTNIKAIDYAINIHKQ